MSAIAGINGDVWMSTSPPTALGSPETCTDSGDHIHYFASVHQAWDLTQTMVVQNSPNGSSGWVTVTDYVFYWPVGEIVFNSARVPGTNNFVKILTGNYFTLSALDGAHSWSMSMSGTVKDATQFNSSPSGWVQNLPMLKSMTFTVNCYRQDARILSEMISSGVDLINVSSGLILCQLYFNEAGGARWQFYARPTGLAQTAMVSDIDTQNLTFQCNGPAYYITSNTFTTASVIQI